VADVLMVPATAVTGNAVISNMRLQLSSVSMLYTMRVTSGLTSEAINTRLSGAIASGTYMRILEETSSLSILSLTAVLYVEEISAEDTSIAPSFAPVTGHVQAGISFVLRHL
jgi:hypothetical protein